MKHRRGSISNTECGLVIIFIGSQTHETRQGPDILGIFSQAERDRTGIFPVQLGCLMGSGGWQQWPAPLCLFQIAYMATSFLWTAAPKVRKALSSPCRVTEQETEVRKA